MKLYQKLIAGLLLAVTILLPTQAFAYVSVKGYYKSNGTYVAPYVRSNPNGLKYDNYGYKPSQGLYNPSYGTKGTTWNTPTYVTDPNYYTGLNLYNTGNTSYKPKVVVPANAKLDYFSTGWNCNSGYNKNYILNSCDKVIVPANAKLDYFGTGWNCDYGYVKNYLNNTCKKY